ncbi:type II toxin-antitoxin system HipA family toxin YjjJ [Oleiagrimonas sp. MCCC 1A03011]|uniref:type II toxin-antitoxin system HipA family toxin YjjJ n=1 Tax=Oleiagrimonas sp. MCCC 1A03011 TaxID=1926883 RepID=UPI000DC5E25C|nr:type II toxin-antitoxin system HipA family toxin YjjJ [Oleiagrimonas sp. MCCC 1A03011]RAP57252.1 transcriptional regulator [Oleiagrimonas sp. MCCC 1A03011]
MVVALLNTLRRRGPSAAADLSRELGISQPTLSRRIADAGEHIVHMGRARATRYALARDVRGLGSRWPLYRIDTQGRPHRFALLHALHNDHFYLETDHAPAWLRGEFSRGLFPGLPWFMDDMRAQGFLGRAFAQRHANELGLRNELNLWDAADTLTALLLRGDDAPGNFVVGENALKRALETPPQTVDAAQRGSRYAELAQAAMRGDPVGSSAAGEQPKFATRILADDGSVRDAIVKFTERLDTGDAVARRWADLLHAEYIAARLMSAHGIECALVDCIDADDRRYLESIRFDRIGAHGRRGFVTLAALDDAHYGERDDWAHAALRLQRDDWISPDDARQMSLRWWFGRLIANNDMHFGNLGFFLDDALPLLLAPSYDMLPMAYRPKTSGALPGHVTEPPSPLPEFLDVWREAASLAEGYWCTLAEDSRISSSFHDIAGANAARIRETLKRFG